MWSMFDASNALQEVRGEKIRSGEKIFFGCCEGKDTSEENNGMVQRLAPNGVSFFKIVACLVPCMPQSSSDTPYKVPEYK